VAAVDVSDSGGITSRYDGDVVAMICGGATRRYRKLRSEGVL